ncbi:tetratricopeptide repeat protein [uncultured Roseibium sp.]|uniref:tetratricopeptide repeat protein n=1 Tax=uncultured Roseibium sp. TaxID=1936171 RepID=UPI002607A503|nr:tetratricopeptide repeat protein [uncultured Roseibium sp.]
MTQPLCVLVVLLFCGPGLAATANATPDQDALFKALKNAQNEAEARKIEDDIWYSWLNAAPTPEIRKQIDTAMQRRGVHDFQGARDLLDEVVAQAPDYSEGWNQRAFILFLQGDYEASLEDIERALELEPRHFGALSGKAMIFMTMGRVKLGQEALREAIAIHPFLKERDMLIEPQGVDL